MLLKFNRLHDRELGSSQNPAAIPFRVLDPVRGQTRPVSFPSPGDSRDIVDPSVLVRHLVEIGRFLSPPEQSDDSGPLRPRTTTIEEIEMLVFDDVSHLGASDKT